MISHSRRAENTGTFCFIDTCTHTVHETQYIATIKLRGDAAAMYPLLCGSHFNAIQSLRLIYIDILTIITFRWSIEANLMRFGYTTTLTHSRFRFLLQILHSSLVYPAVSTLCIISGNIFEIIKKLFDRINAKFVCPYYFKSFIYICRLFYFCIERAFTASTTFHFNGLIRFCVEEGSDGSHFSWSSSIFFVTRNYDR